MSMKEFRISKIFNPETGKAVVIPIDHGLDGLIYKGLEDPVRVLNKLIRVGIDATLMGPGLTKITQSFFDKKNAPARILTSDFYLGYNIPGQEGDIYGCTPLSSVEQAIRWGCDAVKVVIIWGMAKEAQLNNIKLVASLARECDKWEMPLMVEPLLLGRDIPREKRNDPELVATACRIAVELGADILKAPYTGDIESFSKIVDTAHVPVLVLGGPKMDTTRGVLQVAKDSVDAGAKGIVFGRNVWQNPEMEKVVKALKDIVHFNKAVDEVIEEYGIS